MKLKDVSRDYKQLPSHTYFNLLVLAVCLNMQPYNLLVVAVCLNMQP